MSDFYLQPGLAQPAPSELDLPYWNGLQENVLNVQRCGACQGWQWGPEWICHHCLSTDVGFEPVSATGVIYSYERVWHPVHPALAEQGPYLVVLVELPHAGDIRMIGNLLGDAQQPVTIGAAVEGVFEHHPEAQPTYTLLHWRIAE